MSTDVVQAGERMGEVDGVEYPLLLDANDAARILNVSKSTILRMCAEGELKAVKVRGSWRINRDALMEYAGLV